MVDMKDLEQNLKLKEMAESEPAGEHVRINPNKSQKKIKNMVQTQRGKHNRLQSA